MGKTYWIIGGENRLFSKIYWAQSSESLQYDLIEVYYGDLYHSYPSVIINPIYYQRKVILWLSAI